jgi:hypothetical protein
MAEDEGDLAIISAAMQDAVVQMKDVSFDRKRRRFALSANRFMWEAAGERAPYHRVRTALALENVLGLKTRKLRQDASGAVASILALRWSPAAEPPGGAVEITLAGGGAIRVEVEALEVLMLDLSDPWPTQSRPNHTPDPQDR